ncbi:MAG: polymerase [Treponema sp.]|nr:polymerase [Treponema sp.]
MKRKIAVLCMVAFAAVAVFGEAGIGITGTVEWDTLEIKAEVSLDLASVGIRLPSGRSQGEALVHSGYLRLIQQGIRDLQVDSSSTIGDLIGRGDLNLHDTETYAVRAHSVPPALSPDLRNICAAYTISIDSITSSLLRHSRPLEITRTLNPVSAPVYTGIIIIATEPLPIYSMRSSALAVPCLFPKIWDTEMNLIFERNMLDTDRTAMVRYATGRSIFQDNPSGLSPEITALVGDRPMRIFARGVFGINPTDIIIDHNDSLQIISSAENRRLLSQGRVAIILDDSVLRKEL